MSFQLSSIEREYKERVRSATYRTPDDIAVTIQVPHAQAAVQKSRSLSQHNATPRMMRQHAFDLPVNGMHSNSLNNSQNIWLSPNNSFESNSTSPSIQRAAHQQWLKHQSSVNSSTPSNGEAKSYATNSRSRRSSEHKGSRHRFSLIPQVSVPWCLGSSE